MPPAHEAPTCGWDTVFAVPVERVNQAIISNGSSPKSIDFTDPDTGIRVTANFGDWQICRGGDGGLIKLAVPFQDFTATKPSGDKFQTPLLMARVQVRLKFFSTEDDPNIPGTERHLRLKTSTEDPTNDPLVSVNYDWGATKPKGIFKYGSEAAIEDWIESHLADFEHVFAVAILNDDVAEGDWSFLKPRRVDYAYVERDDADNSTLAVLCMTTPDSAPEVQQVSNYAIPPESEAGFLLSPKLLLGKLMMTAFKHVWSNCQDDYFTCDSNVLQLKSDKAFDLPPVHHDGRDFTPRLENLTIRVFSNTIQVDSYTTCPVSPGITSTCNATHFYSIILEQKNGSQTLSFQELTEKAVQSSQVVKDNSVTITEEVIKWVAIAGLIVSAILAPFTEGMSLVIGGVIFGLLLGITEVTMIEIEKYRAGDAPAVDMLVIQATSPIRWDANHVFDLNYAGVNGSLQLGGTWKK